MLEQTDSSISEGVGFLREPGCWRCRRRLTSTVTLPSDVATCVVTVGFGAAVLLLFLVLVADVAGNLSWEIMYRLGSDTFVSQPSYTDTECVPTEILSWQFVIQNYPHLEVFCNCETINIFYLISLAVCRVSLVIFNCLLLTENQNIYGIFDQQMTNTFCILG